MSLTCTLELLHREYTWPGIHSFIKEYVGSCTNCAGAKVPQHCPYGLLKQLPIPECPWHSISMDFIEHLSSSSSYTSILVVVDWLSKQGIFILTYDTISSPDLVKLFISQVFSKHGVPSHITSDRGLEFISHFFCSLGKALGTTLHFTPGYHLEGDCYSIGGPPYFFPHQSLSLHIPSKLPWKNWHDLVQEHAHSWRNNPLLLAPNPSLSHNLYQEVPNFLSQLSNISYCSPSMVTPYFLLRTCLGTDSLWLFPSTSHYSRAMSPYSIYGHISFPFMDTSMSRRALLHSI